MRNKASKCSSLNNNNRTNNNSNNVLRSKTGENRMSWPNYATPLIRNLSFTWTIMAPSWSLGRNSSNLITRLQKFSKRICRTRRPCELIMAFNHLLMLIKLQTFNNIILMRITRLWKRSSKISCISVTKLILLQVADYLRSNRTLLAHKTLTCSTNLLNWQCLLQLRTPKSC